VKASLKHPPGLELIGITADRSFIEGSFFLRGLEKERRWFVQELHKLCPEEARFLDVGCGGGFLLHSLSKVRQPSRLYGIDVNSSVIRTAKKRIKANFILASASSLPFKQETFDVMSMVDILHHVTNTKGAVRDMLRVLRKQGHVILTEPAVSSRITAVLAYIYTKVLGKITKQPWTAMFLTPKEIFLLFPNVKTMHVREVFLKKVFYLKAARVFLIAERSQT
jgi:ubiquinone/menaquinone biosynthesis C-methylase UbiE